MKMLNLSFADRKLQGLFAEPFIRSKPETASPGRETQPGTACTVGKPSQAGRIKAAGEPGYSVRLVRALRQVSPGITFKPEGRKGEGGEHTEGRKPVSDEPQSPWFSKS